MINRFASDPKKLFLLDALGAVLSAFLLGVVLVRFEHLFGIPVNTLYLLAAIPVFFACYDLFSIRKEATRFGQLLKGIALMNLGYCILSLGFAFFHFSKITLLGWTYILIEIAIVASIALLEYKVSNRLTATD